MRYTPKEETVFIHVDYKPASMRFGSKYFPWEDTLNSITLTKLTCIEHHRVPGEWDDVVQYDGFLFTDPEGNKWANQYPRASYGQISDTQNWVVRTRINDKYRKMTDIRIYLDEVSQGVRDLEREGKKATTAADTAKINFMATSLKAHFEDVRLKLIEQFNLEAIDEPHENIPNFYNIVIRKVDDGAKGPASAEVLKEKLENKTVYVTQGGGRAVRDGDDYVFTVAPPNQSFMIGQRVPKEWGLQPLKQADAVVMNDAVHPDD